MANTIKTGNSDQEERAFTKYSLIKSEPYALVKAWSNGSTLIE